MKTDLARRNEMSESTAQAIQSTETSLVELLLSNKKDTMLEIAEKNGAEVKKSHTKAKIAVDLAEQMQQHFADFLVYTSRKGVAVLKKVVEQSEGTPLSITTDEAKELAVVADYGYLYVNKTEKEGFYPVLPNEIAALFNQLAADKSYQEKLEHNQKLFDIVLALVHLYGVYDVDQLIAVWNRHQSDVLTKEAAMDYLEKVGIRQPYFYFNGSLVIDGYFADEKEALTFYDKLNAHNIPYFAPTGTELQLYAENKINLASPNYLNMRNYIQTKGYDSATEERILDEISKGAVLGTQPDKLYQTLAAVGLKFMVEDDVITFVQLFKELSEQTRKWGYRGLSPAEVLAMKEKNSTREPVTVKKIGRNEPCPCGSGKKYKKCHGK